MHSNFPNIPSPRLRFNFDMIATMATCLIYAGHRIAWLLVKTW